MARANFVENPVWSAISEGFKNDSYIADQVLPVVPVPAEIFNCDYYPVGQHLVAPENEVGRLDRPKQLDFQAKQRSFTTKDYAYDAPLPSFDLERAEQQRKGQNMGYDPEAVAIEGITEAQALRREIRVANLVFNINTYLATQRQVVAGQSQWNQVTARPIDQILAVLDRMLIRPNTMVLSRIGWTALSRNVQVVEAALGTSAREGFATIQQVKELLGLKEVLIGDSWRSQAEQQDLDRPTEIVNRLWGSNCALLHINPGVKTTTGSGRYTFGMTAQYGARRAGRIVDPDMGARGGERARVMDHQLEVVSAPFCGYYFQDVAPQSANLSISNVM
jgi:hypothetical protein